MTVRAANSKGRRVDTLPLPGEVAEIMKKYLAERSTNKLVWPGSWWRKSAKILQQDLKDAGIAAVDQQGQVVDFHGQRTTFITGLARAGVTPAAAQKLARHTDINLTLNTYTRLQLGELAVAVGKLPMLGSSLNYPNGDAIESKTDEIVPGAGLRLVVEAWPTISDEVRSAVLRLIAKAAELSS